MRKSIVIVALILIVLACLVTAWFLVDRDKESGSNVNTDQEVNNTIYDEWILVDDASDAGIPDLEGYEITLQISEDGKISTFACNSISGTFIFGANNSFTIPEGLASTKMLCPTIKGLDDYENIYANNLSDSQRIELVNKDRLRIYYGSYYYLDYQRKD